MGTATTRPHLDRLFRLVSEVVFCFDGDRAGRKAAWKALDECLPVLSDGRQVSFLFLPDGEDPDSMVRQDGRDGFTERMNNATSLPDFLFDELSGQVDLGRIDGRARFVDLTRPYINKLPRGVLRDLIVEQLAQLARTETETLERTLAGETQSISPTQNKPRPRPRKSGERLEPLSHAISLALQAPAVVREYDGDLESLTDLEQPGVDMLLEIATVAGEHPELGPAALLERFRDHRYHQRLEELATRDHLIPEDGYGMEFAEAIKALTARLLDQDIEALQARVASGQATDGDRDRLNALLKKRLGRN